VLDGLQVLSEPTASTQSGATPPLNSEWQARLANVRYLLGESDAQALTALHELQGLAPDPLIATQLHQVIQQAESFDFDQALELLADMS